MFAVFESAAAATAAAVRGPAGPGRAVMAGAGPRSDGTPHRRRAFPGGDDYVGIDVHRAARIAAAGHGGQILLSGATRALVEHRLPDGVGVRELGRHRLRTWPNTPEELIRLVVDGLPSEFPPPRTLDAPSSLPTPLTGFVGASRAVDGSRAPRRDPTPHADRAGRLGKSRLAIEAAPRLVRPFRTARSLSSSRPDHGPRLVHPAIATLDSALREDPGRPIRDG